MKLLIIVTHKENANTLEAALVDKKYFLTRMETRGGFLKKKNSTFLLGAKDKQVDEILEVVKKICKAKEEFVAAPAFGSTVAGDLSATNGVAKVKTGGATVFVVCLEKLVKI